MLRIYCPYCGLRDHIEFKFGGEGGVTRPARPEQVSDTEWADYLFYRNNTKGPHHELWVHRFGCRQWFNVIRDTVTHEIVESYPIGEQPGNTND